MYRKYFSILFTVLALCMQLSAQWNIYAQKLNRTLVKDLLLQQSSLRTDTFHFFGPTFDLQENVKTKGYNLFGEDQSKKVQMSIQAKDSVCKIVIPDGLLLRKSKSFLYINCFTDNISTYDISLNDGVNTYTKNFSTGGNRYQIPFEMPLSAWDWSKSSKGQQPTTGDSCKIYEINIKIRKTQPDKEAVFITGELKIFEHLLKQEAARGYFFYQITGDSVNLSPTFTVKRFGNSYPMSSFTVYRDLFAQAYTFSPGGKMEERILQDSTLGLFRYIIDKYPYYEEHALNKTIITEKLAQILASPQQFSTKLAGIDSLLNTFSDGHFYIDKLAARTTSGPVYAKEINGSFQIIAVFDPRLLQQITPGDELLSIDGIPVEKYIQTVSTRYYGDSFARRNQAISRMLFKPSNDSTLLEINGISGKRTVKYFYNGKLDIPLAFRPANRTIQSNQDYFYYRLNKWDVGDWLTFYNHKDELSRSTAVIFDLRGNTGGLEVEAFKMFSCFIKRPVTISDSYYAFSESRIASAPNIILPNRFLNLTGKKIIALVDNNTACASEIFINALKHYSNVVVVGSEKTAGSYASGEMLYLPFNIAVHVNVLSKFSNKGKNNEIEMKGIVPDVKVAMNNYKDLYPYEDKILQTAISLVRSAL